MTAVTIDAIETTYAGCRFRSRLEARWCVLFTMLGVKWEYEPQGYEINVGGEKRPYLPDFWLPEVDGGIWCEVKGSEEGLDLPLMAYAAHPDHGLPDNLAGERRSHLARRRRVLILGPIPAENGHFLPLHCVLTWQRDWGVEAEGVLFLGSALLGTELSMPVMDDAGDFFLSKAQVWDRINGGLCIPTGMSLAYRAARMARFEHGEKPPAVRPGDPKLIRDDVRKIAERRS